MSDENVSKPLTYSSYLCLDELLDLQRPRSEGPEHDEMLFIVIHQVYELWFKEVLHELTYLQRRLEGNDSPEALATLKRILTILKTLVGQIDVLETMTPISFNSFRSRLESASGFQSGQFRELEFVLGHRRIGMVHHFPAGTGTRSRLENLMKEPALWDSFLRYLLANGYTIPEDVLARDLRQDYEGDARVQDLLVEVYRGEPILRMMCERLIDFDEGLQEWRYRHVKMVERTIGAKRGTGGSEGAEYLKMTLFQPTFPDLWAIRTRL